MHRNQRNAAPCPSQGAEANDAICTRIECSFTASIKASNPDPPPFLRALLDSTNNHPLPTHTLHLFNQRATLMQRSDIITASYTLPIYKNIGNGPPSSHVCEF
jgi:hypothetical protein